VPCTAEAPRKRIPGSCPCTTLLPAAFLSLQPFSPCLPAESSHCPFHRSSPPPGGYEHPAFPSHSALGPGWRQLAPRSGSHRASSGGFHPGLFLCHSAPPWHAALPAAAPPWSPATTVSSPQAVLRQHAGHRHTPCLPRHTPTPFPATPRAQLSQHGPKHLACPRHTPHLKGLCPLTPTLPLRSHPAKPLLRQPAAPMVSAPGAMPRGAGPWEYQGGRSRWRFTPGATRGSVVSPTVVWPRAQGTQESGGRPLGCHIQRAGRPEDARTVPCKGLQGWGLREGG